MVLYITVHFPTIREDIVSEAEIYINVDELEDYIQTKQPILCKFDIPTDNHGDKLLAQIGTIKIFATLFPNEEDPRELLQIPFDPEAFSIAIEENKGKRKLKQEKESNDSYVSKKHEEVGCTTEYYMTSQEKHAKAKFEDLHTIHLLIEDLDLFFNALRPAESMET